MSELIITKEVSCGYATQSGTIYYQITVENPTEFWATNMTLRDNLSDLYKPESLSYSLDGMQTWMPWTGSIELDDLEPKSVGFLHLKGVVTTGAAGTIENTAFVENVLFCTLEEDI